MSVTSFGIDLGTTFSCAAYFIKDKVEIIDSDVGKATFPSIVQYDLKKNKIVVGDAAQNNLVKDSEGVLYDSKRLIGKKYDAIDKDYFATCPFHIIEQHQKPVYTFFGQIRTPMEVSTEVLKYIFERAKQRLPGDNINNVVITVPAYFSNSQREATKKAGEDAGLNILRLINEPTAAAVAYVFENGMDTVNSRILVYDFGGGTFDVSIIEVVKNEITVLATDGDNHLGGQDITKCLMDYCIQKAKEDLGVDLNKNPTDIKTIKKLNRLRNSVNEAKVQLSTAFEYEISCPGTDDTLKISRSLLNNLCEHLYKRTIDIVNKTVQQIEDPAKRKIDCIVLVGGSSRIPRVEELLSSTFKIPIYKKINPDEAVAKGAAYFANSLVTKNVNQQYIIHDILNHSVGLEGFKNGCYGTMVPMLKKNSILPCNKTQNFNNQTYAPDAILNIYEGEASKVTECTKIGQFKIDIPRKRAGEVSIKVTFSIDLDGVLTVTATTDNKPATITISI